MKLFLDDFRVPRDCLSYMHARIGPMNPIYNEEGWFVVRSYPAFISAVNMFKGQITHVSFDHDLAEGHYHEGVINYDSEDFNLDDYNKTGYHAAKYLKEVYEKENLSLPKMFVHSMNPVGTENIINLFKSFR